MELKLTCLILLMGKCLELHAYNIDLDSVIYYSPDPDISKWNLNPAYFGYSLAFYESENISWLLVGAPKSNVTDPVVSRLNSPGVVYKCPVLLTNASCHHLHNHSRDFASEKIIADHQMYGATLDVSKDQTGVNQVVVGAFKTIYTEKHNNIISERFSPGLCYKHDENSTAVYMLREKEYTKVGDKDVYLGAYAMLGMSMHRTQTDKRLIMGVPGLLQWRGGVVIHNGSKNCTFYNTSLQENSYLGYTISSIKAPGERSYVVLGAPRYNLYGKVFILDIDDVCSATVIDELVENKYGSFFGASLSVVDVDDDGFDEILVGAPFYNLSKGDEGAVFVFKNISGSYKNVRMLTGSGKIGSRFGSSMHSLGDINMDGFQDVVIGSPYEDAGVIYFYIGSKDTFVNKHYQKIMGTSLNKKLKRFGYSFKIMPDKNSYGALAISSYLSDTVALMRIRPLFHVVVGITISKNEVVWKYRDCVKSSNQTVQLEVSLNFVYIIPQKEIQKFGRNFYFKTEVDYKFLVDLPLHRGLVVTKDNKEVKELRHKVVFMGGSSAKQTVQNWTLRFHIETQPRSIKEPVKLDVQIIGSKTLDSGQLIKPMLDVASPNNFSSQIYFAKECESEVCRSILTSTIKQLQNVDVGSRAPAVFNVVLLNHGETAYNTKFIVAYPSWLRYDRIKMKQFCYTFDCSPTAFNHSLSCQIDRPIPGSSSIVFDLYLLNKEVNDSIDNTFNISIEFLKSYAGKQEFRFPTFYHSNIFLITASEETLSVESNENTTSYRMSHFYDIRNLGPGLYPTLCLSIMLPKQPTTSSLCCIESTVEIVYKKKFNGDTYNVTSNLTETSDKTGLQQYLEDRQDKSSSAFLKCRNVQCDVYQVQLSNVKPNDSIDAKVNTLIYGPILDLIKNFSFFQYSTEVVITPSSLSQTRTVLKNRSCGIESSLTKEIQSIFITPSNKKMVPIWLVATCVALGVLHLVILILVLKKCGFFRRTKHERLQEEKKEVNNCVTNLEEAKEPLEEINVIGE